MQNITTHPGTYGRESHGVFTVVGSRRNDGFPHRLRIWSDGSVTLQAEATVIAARRLPAEERDQHLGTITVGDTVLVDGKPYTVRRRPLAGPELVPADTDPGTPAA